MENNFFQSSMMPLSNEKAYGRNNDDTSGTNYCHHCFQNRDSTSEMFGLSSIFIIVYMIGLLWRDAKIKGLNN